MARNKVVYGEEECVVVVSVSRVCVVARNKGVYHNFGEYGEEECVLLVRCEC